MTSLRGKSALVTGSTSGIGLAIAEALAAAGANVMMNGFGDVERARATVRAAGAVHGARVEHHGANLANVDEVEAMHRAASEALGGVDVLVNNAGIQHVAKVEDFPPERWDAVLAVNLTAAYHTTRLVLPGMRARDWGRIVNVASVHGLVASAEKSAYVASKHGLVGLTKVVALETARTNVTCNAICPGWVQTPLVEAQVQARAEREGRDPSAAREALVGEKQPSGAFVSPSSLAELALFLCSDAAREVRGVAWNVDGGWVAQ
ncbi:3-hydroxybutyrate dehydrogenase [Sandaracinus amylolyticus]|uniref:D-beta-hydroxybutyrate dehydrogenase n=1 Tax=Sandaracinus amylolyticus TaxID=927083 RepID=A0A0F6W9Y9_9BACT|nr:3-hydroxybutyrate dehydrogenase [Sandaracinus amylolyticus]AKF11212.1 D-beta-hydroxybutyrate dehydrogenase [Sandaracinus amylolyticus]